MGFFDTLRRALSGDHTTPVNPRLSNAWGLDGEDEPHPPTAAHEPAVEPGLYDRKNWQKKLKRVLEELPDSQGDWPELMSEARALNFDPDWVTRCQIEEFLLLIRRAVADRHLTEAEHRKLDLARDLIGITESEAEAALQTVMAEAEQFFGKPVEEG